MRFEETYKNWHQKRLTQAEASQLLGICERTFRRQVARYEADGLEGLIDKRLDQASHRFVLRIWKGLQKNKSVTFFI